MNEIARKPLPGAWAKSYGFPAGRDPAFIKISLQSIQGPLWHGPRKGEAEKPRVLKRAGRFLNVPGYLKTRKDLWPLP
jgi:hypothetical protein